MNKDNSCMIISYLTIRRLIGIFGILIPFVMVLGSLFGDKPVMQPAISDYYYLNVRDVFVGVLCAVSVFLLCYRGYKKWYDIATSIVAGIGLLGTALFPTLNPEAPPHVGLFNLIPKISFPFHLAFAALFFVSIAVISLFIFTMSTAKKKTPQKEKRNIVYIVCGIVILAALALILVYNLFFTGDRAIPALDNLHPLFWLESVSLFAFGVSWLVKGETLLRDGAKKK